MTSEDIKHQLIIRRGEKKDEKEENYNKV